MRFQSILLLTLVALSCNKPKPPRQESKLPALPTSPSFQRAEYFNDSTRQADSAFFYFNETAKNTNDSLLAAMAYTYMTYIQYNAGDNYGSQESALAGIKLLNAADPQQMYSLSGLYNMLAKSELALRRYPEAIAQFRQAMRLQPYEQYKNVYLNNIAVALRESGNYATGLSTFDSTLALPDESILEVARRNTTIATLRWRLDPGFNPIPQLHNALSIREKEGDKFGIASSYQHLAEYHLAHHSDSSLFYSQKMYDQAVEIGSIEDELNALKKLTEVAPLAESRRLFQRFETLNDSIQAAQNAAKNQFAVIRYESEKSKAENQILSQDNIRKNLMILNRTILAAAIAIISVLTFLFILFLYRRKKLQAEERSRAAIRDHQLKVSQKVHDTVANGLYRVMSEIEYQQQLNKEELLDKIENLYERSRDISYDDLSADENTAERFNELLASFATPDTKISAVGNQQKLWNEVPRAIVKELEQVLQELLVNMSKHSAASLVVLRFARTDDQLEVQYKDDGQGFPANFAKGNGLRSTENRIQKFGGEITFTAGTSKGAAIKIHVPLTKA